MVRDPRSLQLKVFEGLWLRFVDLESRACRPHVCGGRLRRPRRERRFCPWNAGRWRVGPETVRTDADAELELDIADLASAYLGAFDFNDSPLPNACAS